MKNKEELLNRLEEYHKVCYRRLLNAEAEKDYMYAVVLLQATALLIKHVKDEFDDI